ncbi:VPS10 domain-containing protein [Ktedonospora formicarum]|uniref:Sortilin N-terminal domain-containing protein n=1 Tax=Ktedonospora formicarum TaxID=2778364 RepID=A0A8J3I4T4_9CHLR|nr:exo-alpha-sialidase [Ktedonospora formicarum]GHO49499.1 hypothetical protein KSX_76620 [Ktedonospora formicarum]
MKRPFDTTEDEQNNTRLTHALTDLYRPSRDDQASLVRIRQRLQTKAAGRGTLSSTDQYMPDHATRLAASSHDQQPIPLPRNKTRKTSRGLRFLGLLAAILVTALVVGSFAFILTARQPQISTKHPTTPISKQTHRLVLSNTLYMASPSTGWALAAKGKNGDTVFPQALLRTTDGGKTWQDVSPKMKSSSNLPNVFVLDEKTAWYVALQDRGNTPMYRTTDGGKSWQPCDIPMDTENDGLQALTFINDKDGWLLLSHKTPKGYTLYQTHNGGSSWQEIGHTGKNASSLPSKGQPYQISFTDQRHGYFLTYPLNGIPATLNATQDGGKTWKELTLTTPSGWKSTQLQQIDFLFNSQGKDAFLLSFGNSVTRQFQSYVYTGSGNSNQWDMKALSTTYSEFIAGDEQHIAFKAMGIPNNQHFTFTVQQYILQDGKWELGISSPFADRTYISSSFTDIQHGWSLVRPNYDFTLRADTNIQLRVTSDGGKTWTTLHPKLPNGILWML